MSLASGSRLAHYEILGSIGAGGMGEVYRASDTKLSRLVALKILPDAFASDPERRARFAREARSLAALNHPHIAQIYGFEDAGPTSALVMELVEGEDLSLRIKRGPIPYDEAIAIAKQIAQALEAAHDQGIIHRDLKPANIKLRDDGTIKVLDFGLAKALDPGSGPGAPGSGNLSHSPTITNPAGVTLGGVILGTAAYMSPEQAKGRVVDKRADIWAFGCVLYEMLTGRKAFAGDDVSDTLASVLKSDPDYTGVPPRVTKLLMKCLEKDPRRRLHDIGDAWDLIEDVAPAPQPSSTARSWLPWSLAALFLLSTIALVALRLTERPIVPSSARFQIEPPPKYNFDIYLAVSPDGKRLAFTAANAERNISLWVRDLESLEARQLPGTEGAGSPFWSPDSRYLGFGIGRTLKKIDVTGGPPQTLTEAPTNVGVGAWSRDGVIVFGTRGLGGIRRVVATGGPAVDLTTLDSARGESVHSFPFFLPDGRRFLYWRQSSRPELQGIYVGSIDKPAGEQDTTVLVTTTLGPIAATSGPEGGRLLFLRNATLLAQPFDADRAQLSGDPVPIGEQIGSNGSFGFFSANADVLVYRTGTPIMGNNQRLTWVGRKGDTIGTIGDPLSIASGPGAVAIAPNGRHVAVMMARQTPNPDLWIIELARGIASRFTFNEAPDTSPVWSPDSARIAFRTMREGTADLFAKEVNGTADEAALTSPRAPGLPSDWSPDGRYLLFTRFKFGNDADLWVLPLNAKAPETLLQTQFSEQSARFSPDGRWIAYMSNESGANEIYLRPFAISAEGKPGLGPKWRVSTNGGTTPNWRRDGKELFYRGRGGEMMAADVVTKAGAVETGNPRQLFMPPPNVLGWDVSADGQRFLLSIPAAPLVSEATAPDPVTVVLNWQRALQKR
jgi:serine/threonine protein kinase